MLLRAVNMHPWKAQVQHVDFQRVRADQKIHMKVPLHFVNAELSPAVKVAGAVINHVMNELDIRCLPADLPEFIEVDLSKITVAHSIHVKDLQLPKGVTRSCTAARTRPLPASLPKAVPTEEEEAAAAAEASRRRSCRGRSSFRRPRSSRRAGDGRKGRGQAAKADKGEKK